MQVNIATYSTFGFLILAFCATWITQVKGFQHRSPTLPISALGLSICSGLVTGLLHFAALLSVVFLIGLAYLYFHERTKAKARLIVFFSLVILSLLLALHKLPGFDNPLLLNQYRFSADSLPVSMYASYDKSVAGLVLFYFLLRTRVDISLPKIRWGQVCTLGLANITILTAIGYALKFVRPDFKLPSFSLLFLISNFFLTCISEEVFFRGILQAKIQAGMKNMRYGAMYAVLVSAVLFGIAHFGGGATYMSLATIAGIFYGISFAGTRRIEIPILVHFSFNAFQFIFLSYPALTS